MFIKKDLRKIEEILGDPTDRRESLKLSKRPAEFQGTLQILCRDSRLPALQNLRELNLYENDLTSLKGIGLLAKSPIEEINLGYNKVSSIPIEFGTLTTLKSLWLDDNQLEQFPICLCQLTGLLSLRLTGNDLETLPMSIQSLQSLETLAVDNNRLTEFPLGCLRLPNLRHLWLRQNKITDLPENLDSMAGLETLSMSSNVLVSLPACIATMNSLKKVFANGNRIEIAGSDLSSLPLLQELNLANNAIERIPTAWKEAWGEYDGLLGEFKKSASCQVKVTLRGNPLGDEEGITAAPAASEAEMM